MNETAASLLLAIALEDAGRAEVTRNRAPWIKPYWPDTSYPEGYQNREPYCAAACCHWLAELGRRLAARGLLRKTTGMDSVEYERWRCQHARAFDWRDWAAKKGLLTFPESARAMTGDFIVFDFSHIGLVERDCGRDGFQTVEANTNHVGWRDGDGCWRKTRPRSVAQMLIRAPWMAKELA